MKNKFAWNPENKVLYNMMASCPGVIVINWLFQGMLGMDKSELIFHLLFDLTFTVTFSLVLSLIFPQGLAIILGILMAHSLNWLINTHFWAIARECGITHNHPSRLLKYMKFLGDVANGQPFLLGIAVFGSIARSGTVRSDLDIDMRYVREKGFINGLKANLFSIREKMRAFFSKMPLDSYVCDDVKSLDKLRRNERPIIVYDPKEILKEKYQERGYDLLENMDL